MAIALDAVADSGAANTAGQTSFSFNHILGSGSNRVVIVGIAGRQGGGCAAPTPTYNGTNMTLIQASNWSVGSGWCSGLWVIKEASLPAAGTYAVAVTMVNGDVPASYGVVATSWTGVDQTTPISNAVGGNGGDGTPTLTITSATNNLVITANLIGNDPATYTLVCDGTERVRNNVPNGSPAPARCVVQTKPGAASVVMAPTQSGMSTWSEVGASINAAVAAAVQGGGLFTSSTIVRGQPQRLGGLASPAPRVRTGRR